MINRLNNLPQGIITIRLILIIISIMLLVSQMQTVLEIQLELQTPQVFRIPSGLQTQPVLRTLLVSPIRKVWEILPVRRPLQAL